MLTEEEKKSLAASKNWDEFDRKAYDDGFNMGFAAAVRKKYTTKNKEEWFKQEEALSRAKIDDIYGQVSWSLREVYELHSALERSLEKVRSTERAFKDILSELNLIAEQEDKDD